MKHKHTKLAEIKIDTIIKLHFRATKLNFQPQSNIKNMYHKNITKIK